MAKDVYLLPDADRRELDEERWLLIEADHGGLFYGTGGSVKPNGERVYYASLAESDVSLEAALAGAQQWASKHQAQTIWVQLRP